MNKLTIYGIQHSAPIGDVSSTFVFQLKYATSIIQQFFLSSAFKAITVKYAVVL